MQRKLFNNKPIFTLTLLLAIIFSSIFPLITSGETSSPIHISSFNTHFSSNNCQVIFPSENQGKPFGISAASNIDWLASAHVSSKLNHYTEGLDTDPKFVNQASGKPTAESPTGIISFGGPGVNLVTYWAEYSQNAPIKCEYEAESLHFKHRNGDSINGASIPISAINDNEDMFLIESFMDSENRFFLIGYGFGWKGTYAAGKYFETYIYPNLEKFGTGWIIVKWNDSNENGFVDKPGSGDFYSIVASNSPIGKPTLLDGETVRIGVISSTHDNLDQIVPLYVTILEPDINEYCSKLGYDVNFEFLIDSADGLAATHLEKVQKFHSMGVDIIIGGRWSSQAQASLKYCNDNGILLFSPSSTSPLLSIPDDNLFRLAPDDSVQASAIAEILCSRGIEGVIVLQRGDAWADGIYNMFEREYEAKGGEVLEKIRYATEATDFDNYLMTAENIAQEAINEYGKDHLAVLLVSFNEATVIMAQAQNFPNVNDLVWFGSDGTALTRQFVDDIPEQADHLKVFSPLAAPVYSSKFLEMSDRYETMWDMPLGFYTACDVDIAWILAQAILEVQSCNAIDVKNVLPDVASRHFGVTGWCMLNEAGDRTNSNYDIWGVGTPEGSAEWIKYGYYDAIIDNVHWYSDPESTSISLDNLLNSLQYTPVNFNEFTVVDPGNKLSITPNTLLWTELERNADTRTFIEYEDSLDYFVHRFNFSITDFTYGEGSGRRLVSFWKVSDHDIWVEPLNFTHFYAQPEGEQNEHYVLVFNQRYKGDNQFVHISDSLNVSQTYFATIVKLGDMIELFIHSDSDRTELIWNPGPETLSNHTYRYLLLSEIREYNVDRDIWSSGFMTDFEIHHFH